MRTAKYKTSKPGKADKVKYSITEIRPEEWDTIRAALEAMRGELAREIAEQMNRTDTDGGGEWFE